MTQLTAPRLRHTPVRAFGLSIAFAGAVLAAAVMAQQIAPSAGQASVAAASTTVSFHDWTHQVAPLSPTVRFHDWTNQVAPLSTTVRFHDWTHQVAPLP